MPIIDVPGAGLVRFPDDMSNRDILSYIETNILPRYQTEAPAAPAPAPSRQYFPFGAAVDTTQAALYSALAGAGNLTGIESLRQIGEAGAERNRREAEAAMPPEQRMTFEQAQTPEEYLRAGTQALTYSAPQTLATLGAGVAGGLLGGPAGAIAAGTAVNVPVFYGENRARQEEAIREDASRRGERVNELAALGTAVPQALTETVIDRFTFGLGSILGVPAGFVARNLLPRIAAGIGVGSVAEVPAEVLQTAMERAQAGLSLTSPDAIRELKEVAIGAAVVGGVTRGATAAVRGSAPPPPPPPPARGEDEELAGALRTLEAERAATQAPQAPEAAAQTPVEAGMEAATEATQTPAEAGAVAPGITTPAAEREAVTPPVARPEAAPEVAPEAGAVAVPTAATAPTSPEIAPRIEEGERPQVARPANLKPTAGWKLHIGTEGLNSGAITALRDRINNLGAVFKEGQNSGQVGKDFTIYVGDRSSADRIAKILSPLTSGKVYGDAKVDDIEIAPGVGARFDAHGDSDFHQYGKAGVPILRDLIEFGKPFSDEAIHRSEQELVRRYGEFFSGAPSGETTSSQPQTFTGPIPKIGQIIGSYGASRFNEARARVTGQEDTSWATMPEDQKRQVLGILAAPQASARQTAEAPATEPTAAEAAESARQDAAQVEAARRVVDQRLEALRGMGDQGRLAATGLEEAMARNDLSANQTYEAFRAADIMSKILPAGANHQVEFLNSFTNPEWVGKQGYRTAPTQAMNGVIRLSLDPNNISVVRETAAHEAFHVLQDYYAKYDPKFAALLARDFKEGMTPDDLPANIKKKLSSSYVPGTKTTYFEFLKQNPYEAGQSVSEIQAYVFGSLYDMNTRGVPITGIAPAYVRFINFVKSFFRAYAKDEGSLGALERAVAGDAARFAREAAPVGMAPEVEQASARQVNMSAPEFAKWWNGDWRGDGSVSKPSVARNDDGSPKTYYHGTQFSFAKFGKARSGSHGQEGPFYFSPSASFSNDYAEQALYAGAKKEPKSGQRMLPVYLSAQNPFGATENQLTMLMRHIEDGVDNKTIFLSDITDRETYEIYASMIKSGMLSEATAMKRILARFERTLYDEVDNWRALETPAAQSFIREKGYDSFYLLEDEVLNLAVFDPRQIKSIFNKFERGAATAPQFSARRINNLPPVGTRVQPVTAVNMQDETFNLQYAAVQTWLAKGRVGKFFGEGRVNRFFEKFQDNMLPVGQAIDELRQYGYRVPVALDPYLKQDLMTGKIGTALKERASGLYEPVFTKIRQTGLTQDEVETYLHARHAVERNAEMLRRNPDGGPAGSGMTDTEATNILKKFAAQGKIQKLQSVASLVDNIIADTNNVRVTSGLTPDFAADPNGVKYQHYVPLKRLMEESPFADQGVGEIRARTGKGYGARGREDKLAKGSKREVTNILANVLLQNQEAVIRAEKNAVGNSYLSLIEDLNAKGVKHELGDIITKAPTRYIMQNGVVREIPDFTYKNQPDIMIVKRGGEEVVIRIDDPRLARAMTGATGLSTDSISSFVKGLSMINQFLTRVNTSLNPEFVIVNFLRDIQTAGLALSQYDREKLARQVISDVPKSLAGIRKSVRGGGSDDFTKAFEEFAKLGGTTEYYGLRTLDQTLKSIDDFNATDQSKSSWRKMGDGVKRFGKFFEDYNNIVENGVRVAVFKNLRDSGVSPEKAAQVAKNLTTNFNRGGENRVLMNSLYLFYNASLQGSMALANGLVRSKRLRKIAAGIVVGGFMADMMNAMMSGEEDEEKIYDKIPDYVLEHNIILMDPFGFTKRGYFQVPMPYGFNSFYNTGRAVSRMARGEYTPVEAGKSALLGMVEGFNPIGGTNSFYNFVAPTILDPLFDIARNENFAGQPIVPERGGAGPQPPQSQLYWSSTAYPYVAISQYLNEITGGTPVIPGAIDISPNMIKYGTNFALGALLSFAERVGTTAFSTIPSAMSGDLEELDVREVPFLRKFAGNVTTRNNMERYMQITEEVQRVRREVNDAQQFGEVERINRVIEQYPNQYAISDDVQKLMRERTKLGREIRTIERMADIPEQQKKEVLKALRDQQNLLVGEVIRLYNTTVRRSQ